MIRHQSNPSLLELVMTDEEMAAMLLPEQQEIFRKELPRQHALSDRLKVLVETDDPMVRNQAALNLLDLKTPEHIDFHVTEKLIELVLDPRTEHHRGTLVYVLHEMRMPLKTSTLVQILLDPTNVGETFEETMEFFDDDLFEPDNMAEQITQLEAAMRTISDEHTKEALLEVHTILTEASMVPIQLPFGSRFRNIPWPIVILNKSVAEIAAQNGFALQFWEDDGLGETSGFGVILPTGLWILLYERKHLVERGIATGPTIDIDLDAPSNIKNLPALLKEVLDALGLTEVDVQTKRLDSEKWS